MVGTKSKCAGVDIGRAVVGIRTAEREGVGSLLGNSAITSNRTVNCDVSGCCVDDRAVRDRQVYGQGLEVAGIIRDGARDRQRGASAGSCRSGIGR